MQSSENFINVILAFALLTMSLVEIKKALLILFRNQFHVVLAAKLSFLILAVLAVNAKKQNEIVEDYKKHIKTYGVLTLIGALSFILISLRMIFYSIKP